MRRRKFLEFTVGLLGLILSPNVSAKNKRAHMQMILHLHNDLVLDQSGAFGNGAFVIGTLSCNDFSGVTADIKKLRAETGFKCKLSHASRNKWKARYAKRLIDLWIDGSHLRIDLLLMKDSGGEEKEKPLEKLSRYTESVSRLINISRKRMDGKCRLITQKRFSKDRQSQFEEMLLRRNRGVASIMNIQEDQSDLLQLLDLVVGTVQTSQETTRTPLENVMKKDLVRYLIHRLSTKSLTESLQHPKCSITMV